MSEQVVKLVQQDLTGAVGGLFIFIYHSLSSFAFKPEKLTLSFGHEQLQRY